MTRDNGFYNGNANHFMGQLPPYFHNFSQEPPSEFVQQDPAQWMQKLESANVAAAFDVGGMPVGQQPNIYIRELATTKTGGPVRLQMPVHAPPLIQEQQQQQPLKPMQHMMQTQQIPQVQSIPSHQLQNDQYPRLHEFAHPQPSQRMLERQPVTPQIRLRSSPSWQGSGGSNSGKKKVNRRSKSRATLSMTQEDKDLSEDDDEEFSLEGMKTKSGRKVHKPSQFMPQETSSANRKKSQPRKDDDSYLCAICEKGHSLEGNKIVFCDGCNNGYHQLCHEARIEDYIVADEATKWFCTSCSKAQYEQAAYSSSMTKDTSLTAEERKLYLHSLSHNQLVELILRCEKRYPDLPIYPDNAKQILADLKKPRQPPSASKIRHTSSESKAEEAVEEKPAVEYDRDFAKQMSIPVPSYDQLVSAALISMGPSTPKDIAEWIKQHHRFKGTFETALSDSLQKGKRKGLFENNGEKLDINRRYKISKKRRIIMPELLEGAGLKIPSDRDHSLLDDQREHISHIVCAM